MNYWPHDGKFILSVIYLWVILDHKVKLPSLTWQEQRHTSKKKKKKEGGGWRWGDEEEEVRTNCLSVCLPLTLSQRATGLRHIFVLTARAIYFANSIHAVFTCRQPQSMKNLNDFYLIQTILSNIFAAHQREVGDKSSPLCNGSLHFNHLHLNNPKVFPWILMAHMRKKQLVGVQILIWFLGFTD